MAKIRVAEHLPTDRLRTRVAVCVVSTLLVWCAISWLFYNYFPMHLPAMESPCDKIVFTVRCNVPSALTVLALIGYVGTVRFWSEQIDPLSPKDKHVVEVPQRILQNTLEQFVLSLSLQLSASTWMTGTQMRLIPIIVMWFVLGRIFFWVGYSNPDYGRTNRSFGFSLSMQPSAMLAIFCVIKAVSSLAI